MTWAEFDNEYLVGKYNARTGEYMDFEYVMYAFEAWDCMTDAERAACTFELMDAYIADTYDAVEEQYLSAERGDYSPSNPWDAPGMSISDFI